MNTQAVMKWARANPRVRSTLRSIADAIHYDTTDWVRVVMYQKCFEFIRSLDPGRLDVMEVSAGEHWRKHFEFRSYTPTHYPDFDICRQTLPQKFDLIIADQIFEHLLRPADAARNVLAMLKPGGWFIIATPFLIRVHPSPIDCRRWTEQGLAMFLEDAGFRSDLIKTDSWGNRACVVANFKGWKKRGFFGSLVNEPEFPVTVWAFAQKPEEI
ncbi:MAG: methyltransferase domain-containing protein [Alphaproteobacteria bacterium]|nr:methyltransferase domain-containing protein [Alphaproteobacteria bacterium]